jgi:cytochrome d ubiquinol oxidase subunit II
MSLADVVAALMFLGVLAYAVLGGADFGSGLWDLTAGGDRRGAPIRTLIDHVIGPVWEANHVWLIYVLVFLWTGFPVGFAAIMDTLFIPFGLAGLGIVARGSAFAFRKFAPSLESARVFGVLFATSSVLTPFLFGSIAGAIAAGEVPADGSGDRWSSWTGPTSIIGGTLAVVTCAFLAAAFLTAEAWLRHDPELTERCRRRALLSGVIAGVVALGGIIPLEHDAPTLFDGLTGRALPLVVGSAVAGTASLLSLLRHRYLLARAAAVGAVSMAVAGWGIAQYPWLLADTLTIEDAAGARSTLWGLVVTFVVAGVIVLPALGYLFWITQRPGWVGADALDQRRVPDSSPS